VGWRDVPSSKTAVGEATSEENDDSLWIAVLQIAGGDPVVAEKMLSDPDQLTAHPEVMKLMGLVVVTVTATATGRNNTSITMATRRIKLSPMRRRKNFPAKMLILPKSKRWIQPQSRHRWWHNNSNNNNNDDDDSRNGK
jgi:hypothetical protein